MPRDMNRDLASDAPRDLRDHILGLGRDHHMHMSRHRMTFLSHAPFLLRQAFQYLTQLSSGLPEYRLPPGLRDRYDMTLTLPPAVCDLDFDLVS